MRWKVVDVTVEKEEEASTRTGEAHTIDLYDKLRRPASDSTFLGISSHLDARSRL